MEYNLRSDRPRINYKVLLEPKLPKLTASSGGRASRKIDTQLYPVEIVETEGTRVKIHYVGYADKHDEWSNSTPLPRSSRRRRVATRGGRRSAQSRLRNAAVVVVLRSTG